ncbi:MAG: DUF2184 domain-containing protein [Candidatus Diapherotrites archaeon]|nr:DUF2184 domain-containing protein [Candidatus Diapherotrites archaeon]
MTPFITRDARWMDSTLADFENALNKKDPKLHEPLFNVTWDRDIKLRTDVGFQNASSSFIRTSFAGGGSQSAQGQPWISLDTTDIQGVVLDGEQITTPMRLLARSISYTSVEMERFALAQGGSLDAQKFSALNNLYQLGTDRVVYVGDTDKSFTGLVNDADVTSATVPADGTGNSPLWINKTDIQILRDFSEAENDSWQETGEAVVATKCLIASQKFAYLNGRKMAGDSNKTLLTFIKENSLCMAVNGKPLDIQPCKWLTGAGAGSTDRMMFYTDAEQFLRFPLVPIRRETTYHSGIWFHAPYIWMYGQIEWIEHATARYEDGF